ncbi:MAG: hypothetical protein P4L22_07670 [Candidatus Babeliales bacterium]|nr:hypothetical protein [Candidatus Babeliales bacterium]
MKKLLSFLVLIAFGILDAAPVIKNKANIKKPLIAKKPILKKLGQICSKNAKCLSPYVCSKNRCIKQAVKKTPIKTHAKPILKAKPTAAEIKTALANTKAKLAQASLDKAKSLSELAKAKQLQSIADAKETAQLVGSTNTTAQSDSIATEQANAQVVVDDAQAKVDSSTQDTKDAISEAAEIAQTAQAIPDGAAIAADAKALADKATADAKAQEDAQAALDAKAAADAKAQADAQAEADAKAETDAKAAAYAQADLDAQAAAATKSTSFVLNNNTWWGLGNLSLQCNATNFANKNIKLAITDGRIPNNYSNFAGHSIDLNSSCATIDLYMNPDTNINQSSYAWQFKNVPINIGGNNTFDLNQGDNTFSIIPNGGTPITRNDGNF